METIKISVDVNVNFSEAVQAFFRSLLGGCSCKAAIPEVKQVKSIPGTPSCDKAEETRTTPVIPVTEPTPASNAPKHTIEELRKELAAKVNNHREAIKAKLNAFGAKSLTVLSEDKYDEMYNFLVSL